MINEVYKDLKQGHHSKRQTSKLKQSVHTILSDKPF